jgi:hypothetical protein
MPSSSVCSRCGAEIWWATQVKKDFVAGTLTPVPDAKPNPIDALPRPKDGNLVVNPERTQYRFATGNERQIAERNRKSLYVSHFVVCPSAKEFRKK